ncbi:MAG: hypothetical protein ACK40Z_08855 [Dietzia sp.]
MPQNRGSGLRTRRFGAAVVAAALAAVASPAVGQAQDASGSLPEDTGNGSVDSVIGLLPEEIVIGGPGFGGGSEMLRDTGSGIIPDTALSVGQVIGSVAPLEALGVAGGSAAASVASSGSLPGSVYANATGSIGSGTIGIGSLRISEYAIGALALQAFGAYINVLAARQEAGTLTPDELVFWNNVVVGSAQGGALLEDAADAAGTELPGGLAGSIDAVQRSALENPFEAQDRIRAEAEAEAEAEAAAESEGAVQDDDEVGDSPAATTGDARVIPTGAGAGMPALTAATVPVEPAAQVQAAQERNAAPATLAATGVETTAIAGLATVSLLLGTLLLAGSRRRG